MTRDARTLARAIERADALVRADPDDGVALTDLADALLEAGREDEAIARMEEAARGPSAAANNWLGWYFSRRKLDVPRALAHLDKATTLGGWYGPAHLNRGALLDRLGRADDAYEAYERALMSEDTHDRPFVHTRRAAIELARGWPRHALGSARRALFHEARAPRGHADEARAIERAALEALAGAYAPHEGDERPWIEREHKARREGIGLDLGAAVPSFEAVEEKLATAIRATHGDASPEPRATLEAMLSCAKARALLPEHSLRSFAVDDPRAALVKAARAWAEVHLWMWSLELEREAPPAPGPFEAADKLRREGRFVEAAIAVEAVAAKDVSLLVDAMGLCERAGEEARVRGEFDAAIALLDLAHRGHQIWASWSTSGGEGMARMVDVERLARELRRLRAGRAGS